MQNVFFGQESDSTSHDSNYELQIKNDALEALRKVKHEEVTEEFPKADMWCHFGTGIIRGPDEGNLLGDFFCFYIVEKLKYSWLITSSCLLPF